MLCRLTFGYDSEATGYKEVKNGLTVSWVAGWYTDIRAEADHKHSEPMRYTTPMASHATYTVVDSGVATLAAGAVASVLLLNF